MATRRLNPDEFFALFEDESSSWKPLSASDASRLSVERHQKMRSDIKTALSVGMLRFTGDGVDNHSADATSLFRTGLAFQKMVTAVGSSIIGAKRSLSSKAEQLTKLNLDAAPAAGSIIIHVTTSALPEEELRPNGEIFDGDKQLIDKVFVELDEIFGLAADVTGQAELMEHLQDLGPLAASAVGEFAATTHAARFNLEAEWRQPLEHSIQWKVTTQCADWLAHAISTHKQVDDNYVLEGFLYTVSQSDSWRLTSSEFGIVEINVKEISDRDYAEFHVGSYVRAWCEKEVRVGPAINAKPRFKVHRMITTSPEPMD